MTTEERPLHELVPKLETAWNLSNSVARAARSGEDADFIHILGDTVMDVSPSSKATAPSSTRSTFAATTVTL